MSTGVSGGGGASQGCTDQAGSGVITCAALAAAAAAAKLWDGGWSRQAAGSPRLAAWLTCPWALDPGLRRAAPAPRSYQGGVQLVLLRCQDSRCYPARPASSCGGPPLTSSAGGGGRRGAVTWLLSRGRRGRGRRGCGCIGGVGRRVAGSLQAETVLGLASNTHAGAWWQLCLRHLPRQGEVAAARTRVYWARWEASRREPTAARSGWSGPAACPEMPGMRANASCLVHLHSRTLMILLWAATPTSC
jgi:hypothetical protein